MLTQKPYVEVWFHVHWEGPRPKLAKIFVQKEQEDEEDLWLTGPQWGPPPPPPPPLPTAPPPAPPPYPGLRKELDQLNQDIQNLPFILSSASAFPVLEVQNGTNAQEVAVTSYLTVPIKPSELGKKKKRDPPSYARERPYRPRTIGTFSRPGGILLGELNYLLAHLYTPEERGQIRRAALGAWEQRNANVPNAPAADTKFPLADPNWNPNNAEHREDMRGVSPCMTRGVMVPQPGPMGNPW
ncbi:protein enabled homolog [Python bivittatus]|uniref:Protein enabled homolog n=1 Tax=Python bivittatus TaxID=176946 RepID=A0A9F5J198_PYTBI|nr:protein enabled homolog [Python bivittatus]